MRFFSLVMYGPVLKASFVTLMSIQDGIFTPAHCSVDYKRDAAKLPAESGREGAGEAPAGVHWSDRLCLQSQLGGVLRTATCSCFRSAVPAVTDRCLLRWTGKGQLGTFKQQQQLAEHNRATPRSGTDGRVSVSSFGNKLLASGYSRW